MERNLNNFTVLFLIVIFVFPSYSFSFWSSGAITKSRYLISAISKSPKVLPNKQILELSIIAQDINGPARVGRILGKQKLSDTEIEDAFLRISINQQKINRDEAFELYKNLSGTPGFRTTLRKIIGNSPVVTAGHINELRIASSARKYNYNVIEIGRKFNDGRKQGDTDIDIILEKNKRLMIIEAKDYNPSTFIRVDKYRADLDTLAQFKKSKSNKDIIPLFSFTHRPNSMRLQGILEKEARKRDIELIYGNPESLLHQINMLFKILR